MLNPLITSATKILHAKTNKYAKHMQWNFLKIWKCPSVIYFYATAQVYIVNLWSFEFGKSNRKGRVYREKKSRIR